jgi:hypothetical protein
MSECFSAEIGSIVPLGLGCFPDIYRHFGPDTIVRSH